MDMRVASVAVSSDVSVGGALSIIRFPRTGDLLRGRYLAVGSPAKKFDLPLHFVFA